jgi:hypothetical protein
MVSFQYIGLFLNLPKDITSTSEFMGRIPGTVNINIWSLASALKTPNLKTGTEPGLKGKEALQYAANCTARLQEDRCKC